MTAAVSCDWVKQGKYMDYKEFLLPHWDSCQLLNAQHVVPTPNHTELYNSNTYTLNTYSKYPLYFELQ